MTDYECLMQIINSLELNKNPKNTQVFFDSDGVKIEDNVIIIGSGEGYLDFKAEFKFDENGKCISHRVWE